MSQMVNRTEISPGVILEKFHTKKKRKKFCVLKIEVQMFNALDFKIDFTGSENIKLDKSNNLIQNTLVQPFTKTVVANIQLKKGWTLKTKYTFTKKLPEISIQRNKLGPILKELDEEIRVFNKLKGKDMSNSDPKLLFEFCESKNALFCDPEFPPNYKSIGITQQECIDIHECYIHWRRLKYIFLTQNQVQVTKALPYIFEDGVNPSDIKTGKFDNSWLISGIATLSEKQYLIKRLILTKEPNDQGLYILKLQSFGIWKKLVIDSFFPCFPLGDPIFDSNNGNEFWILLLEKAYAKMHGNYASIMVGNCKEALIDLTGCPTFEIDLPENEDDESDEEENGEDLEQTGNGFYENEEKKFNKEEIWQNLKKWNKYHYLLSTIIREMEIEESIEAVTTEQSYAVIRVYEDKENGIRLINLRNIWDIFHWTGDWSSKSDLWTEEALLKVKPDLTDKTQLWMSYEHYLENFGKLFICYTRSWQELKVRGKFIKTIDDENDKLIHWCSRWYYQLKIDKTTKVIIGIHQEDERSVGVKETRRYIDIGMDLIQLVDGKYKIIDFYPSDFQREVFIEIWLKKGIYYLVPKSVGICLNFENSFKKKISHFSSDNNIVLSVMKDIFRKFDIVFDSKITYKEIILFYEILGKTITEEEFKEVCKKFGTLTNEPKDYLTEEGFVMLFDSLLKHHDRENILEIFEKLGYDEDLQSVNMRLFTLTLHSSNIVNLELKDGLDDHIDFITNRLQLRKYGLNTSKDEEVEKFDLLNKNINSCSYGIYNKSTKSIKVNFEFPLQKNINSHLEDNKIEKIIESGNFEYFMHIQTIPEHDETIPEPIMNWEFVE